MEKLTKLFPHMGEKCDKLSKTKKYNPGGIKPYLYFNQISGYSAANYQRLVTQEAISTHWLEKTVLSLDLPVAYFMTKEARIREVAKIREHFREEFEAVLYPKEAMELVRLRKQIDKLTDERDSLRRIIDKSEK